MARQPSKTTTAAKGAKKTPAKKPAARKPAAPRSRKSTAVAAPPATQPRPLAVPAAVESRVRFTVFNLVGKERAYYVAERFPMERSADDIPEKSVAHQIVVIDRSGSMYSDMEPLKQTLLKLLTLDEFNNYQLLVTLISYSSKGDCKVHFERAPIADIMKPNSSFLAEIKKIHVTGCTCISQGLKRAASLVKPEELTAITLHSDGYANDPSATAESAALEQICADLQGRETFVNTIAYSDCCDFRLLARVANSVSGTCVKAGDIRTVYKALDETARILGGSVAPPLEEPLAPGFDYQVFLSHSGGRTIGSSGTLKICGLRAEDDAAVYKYQKLTKAEFDGMKDVPVRQTHEAVIAFARANLAEGNLNTAKYALASTFNATLLDKHGRALTNNEVAAMTQDLDAVLFQPGILQEHTILDHVPVNKRIALLDLMRLLGANCDGFRLNLSELQKNYRRRGVRRLQGKRDENGVLVKPTLKTEYTDSSTHVRVSSFDINHNTATLNMLISRPVQLVPAAGGAPITQVAGIKLDRLSVFNNYTIVSDGELNVPTMTVRIADKKLFDQLKAEDGLLEQGGAAATTFNAETDYVLRLDRLPLVRPFEGEIKLDGLFEELAEIKVLSSILSAHLKEEAAELTAEQVEELKKHYLSKNLYINFPTTTEYTDLQEALNEGSIDSRVSYKVDLGNCSMLNLSKLMSGNKFLERLYEVTVNGTRLEKPSFDDTLDGAVKFAHKQLSVRVKITAVDEFMRRIFDDFLGLEKNGSVATILAKVGDTELVKVLAERNKGQVVPKQKLVETMTQAAKKLDTYADKVFEEKISPLVFYIGATGVLPDEIDVKGMSADKLQQKYPNLNISKDEMEGMYFEVGKTILGIFAKTEYFSTRAAETDSAM